MRALKASTSWQTTRPLRAVSRRVQWFRRNTRRGSKLLWWLVTGRFGQAGEALLPYYRRYVPRRVRTMIPQKWRHAVNPPVGRAPAKSKPDYREWIIRNDTLSDQDRHLIRHHIESFEIRPKLSILMPVHDTPSEYLREAIESVRNQLYQDWELCVVDDASTNRDIRVMLDNYARKDRRVRPAFRDRNSGISACTNTALEMASGEWIVLMDHDDTLSEHALYLLAEAINNNPDTTIIYSDEDHIDAAGRRYNPYFKPDWDYDFLLGQHFINRFCAYRADLAHQVGGFREGFEGAENRDFTLRVLDASPDMQAHHIPFILYHKRWTSEHVSQSASAQSRDTAARAVNEHFVRTGQAAVAIAQDCSGHLRIRRMLPAERPLVSIVIPTKDRCDLLKTCIDGLLNRTDYQPIEIIIVDNGSSEPDACAYLEKIGSHHNVKVLQDPRPFNFSRLVNQGVTASTGPITVLLNNDVDVINPDWLDEMVSHVLRPEVGAVGAKLYYANDTLQHGGVILGLGGVAGHAHRFLPRQSPGYFNRLNVTHTLSCVTAACVATRRQIYDSLGGFNERDLTVALNDVDFCVRVRQAGYKIIWTPHAQLYHHESISRGVDRTPEQRFRAHAERDYMRKQWGFVIDNDPFHNPNLSLKTLCFDLADFSRVSKPWLKLNGPRLSDRQGLLLLDECNVGSDKRRVDAINFVIVYGCPNAGKTALAQALSDVDGFLCLQTDEIFAFHVAPRVTNIMDFWSYSHRPEGELDIAKYVNSTSYDHALFVILLAKELCRRLSRETTVHTVLLEGYVFLKHRSDIIADLGLRAEQTLALHAYVNQEKYMVGDINVTGRRYDDVLAEIRNTFEEKCVSASIPRSTYQSFESFGLSLQQGKAPSSKTSDKYEASHLDSIVEPTDQFLDIGCNAGYFCFRVAEKSNAAVIGVDTARSCLEIGSHINNSIFLRDNVAFFESDIFDFLPEKRAAFDIIHCSSVYHYFRDRQLEFLKITRDALAEKGVFVLEVELADAGNRASLVRRSRGVDATPCVFPNRAMFLEQISGLFTILNEFESVFQKGSFYERVYFHLQSE